GGKRHEFRMGERIAKGLMSFLSPLFLGALKKYKIISPENIVACMHNLVKNEVQQTLFNSDKIVTIANLKR
ncbi:MAG: nucleoside-diphosphate sugar epimerase, partial [Polaribacter sp.]|nr:nucleoside-diphosphate sugar epimerase [Polaribacter sp.]